MVIRSVADGDRDAIFALGVAEEVAWFGQAEISAEEIGEWIEEEGGVASGVVAVDDAGNVRGFAAPGRHQAVLLADPTRASLLVDELLPWLRERCDVVRLMTFAGDLARVGRSSAMGCGMSVPPFSWRVRQLGRFRAAFPKGSRSCRIGSGTTTRRCIGWSMSMLRGRRLRGTLSAMINGLTWCVAVGRRLLLAAMGGRLGGSPVACWPAAGVTWTCLLAVSERHRGLGRALLLHAFADLQLAGGRDLTLEAQAENAAALGLYRSVGLEVEREWRIYTTASNDA